MMYLNFRDKVFVAEVVIVGAGAIKSEITGC
jgi:hypothetical protein